MEKLKSTLPNMIISLVLICVIAAGALAGVYLLTKKNIEDQKNQKRNAALKAVVLPKADETVKINDLAIDSVALTAVNKQDTTKLDTINLCVVHTIALEDGTIIGKAVETSAVGFGGKQKIMVGFAPDGKIINYKILEQQETPGLGDHIADWFNDSTKVKSYILGRQATGEFKVSKDGGDVDAITAATISSRAFLRAINDAYKAVEKANAPRCCGHHECAGHCQHGEGHECAGHCPHHHEAEGEEVQEQETEVSHE